VSTLNEGLAFGFVFATFGWLIVFSVQNLHVVSRSKGGHCWHCVNAYLGDMFPERQHHCTGCEADHCPTCGQVRAAAKESA
jgi:hypothetical protein